jgi:predicted transposase/invertase (TIGR01784 family)
MRRHNAFAERMVAYNSRQYASQLSRGENYVELKRSISLIITDFSMFDDTDDYFEYITYRRENRKIFTNAQEYFILDLTKLPDEIVDDTAIWGAMFKAETEEELRLLMEQFDEINEAGEKLLDLSEEKYAQELAVDREISQWTAKHIKHHLENHARAVGIEQGIEQEKKRSESENLQRAKQSLDKGMSVIDVSEIFGLKLDEIEKLKK